MIYNNYRLSIASIVSNCHRWQNKWLSLIINEIEFGVLPDPRSQVVKCSGVRGWQPTTRAWQATMNWIFAAAQTNFGHCIWRAATVSERYFQLNASSGSRSSNSNIIVSRTATCIAVRQFTKCNASGIGTPLRLPTANRQHSTADCRLPTADC